MRALRTVRDSVDNRVGATLVVARPISVGHRITGGHKARPYGLGDPA
jgi:hypothetical protein